MLAQPWFGRVYANPPYGRALPPWVNRAADAYERGEIAAAILLLPSRTDTDWFRRLRDYPRCHIDGRLTFVGNANGAPFPSMLVYLGDEPQRFRAAMALLGDTYLRMREEEPGA